MMVGPRGLLIEALRPEPPPKEVAIRIVIVNYRTGPRLTVVAAVELPLSRIPRQPALVIQVAAQVFNLSILRINPPCLAAGVLVGR